MRIARCAEKKQPFGHDKQQFPWGGELIWWQNEDPSTIYPWAYPHLLYHCTFGEDERFKDYVLLRTNRSGEILQMIGLNGTEVSALPKPVGFRQSHAKERVTYYTLRGGKIGNAELYSRRSRLAGDNAVRKMKLTTK